MEANELRIGNYIDRTDYICRVIGIDILDSKKGTIITEPLDFKGERFVIQEQEPIPLTEEWLVKFGFEKLEGWDDMYYFQIGNFQVYEYNVSGYDYDGFNIKHVHQLQNLYFALTNEELTIK